MVKILTGFDLLLDNVREGGTSCTKKQCHGRRPLSSETRIYAVFLCSPVFSNRELLQKILSEFLYITWPCPTWTLKRPGVPVSSTTSAGRLPARSGKRCTEASGWRLGHASPSPPAVFPRKASCAPPNLSVDLVANNPQMRQRYE